MTADRDDLAAILAKHRFRRMDGEQAECVHGDWTQDEDDYRTDPHDAHRAHVAQMVLESDWLRDVKADVWDEGRDVGHEDTYLNLIEGRGDFDAAETPNPYRAGQEGDHAH